MVELRDENTEIQQQIDSGESLQSVADELQQKETASNLSRLGAYIKSKIMRILGLAESEEQLMSKDLPKDFNLKELILTGDGDEDTNIYKMNDSYIVKESLPDADEGISTSQGVLQRAMQKTGVGKFFLGMFTEGKVLSGEEMKDMQNRFTERMKMLNKKAKAMKLRLGENLLDTYYLIRKKDGLPTMYTIQESLPENAIQMSESGAVKKLGEKEMSKSFEAFVKDVSKRAGKSVRLKKKHVAYDPDTQKFFIHNLEGLL